MRLRPSTVALASLVSLTLLVWSSTAVAQTLGGQRRGPIERGPVDVAQLTARADLVVHGFVTNKTAAWVGRVIYTQYELLVQETVKGALRNSVVMAIPGGSLGNVQLSVPGSPDFQIGDQLVFFGEPLEGQTSFTPVGTFDGIVEIRPGDGGTAPTVAPRGSPETLEAFLAELRAAGNGP